MLRVVWAVMDRHRTNTGSDKRRQLTGQPGDLDSERADVRPQAELWLDHMAFNVRGEAPRLRISLRMVRLMGVCTRGRSCANLLSIVANSERSQLN